ncbi:MAG: Mut7-C RNAse domain-containing protein [Candidatus Ranarchaeia archaeon]
MVDAMLGNTCRWLRLLGCDTVYANELEDTEIIKQASKEERIIVTADNNLFNTCKKKAVPCIHLGTRDLATQIIGILNVTGYKPKPENIGSRCTKCNSYLIKIPRTNFHEYMKRVQPIPEGIMTKYDTLWICLSCNQAFWPGHMWERIQKNISNFKGEIKKDVVSCTALRQVDE